MAVDVMTGKPFSPKYQGQRTGVDLAKRGGETFLLLLKPGAEHAEEASAEPIPAQRSDSWSPPHNRETR